MALPENIKSVLFIEFTCIVGKCRLIRISFLLELHVSQ